VKTFLAHLVAFTAVLGLALLFAALAWWGAIAVEAAVIFFFALVLLLTEQVRTAGAEWDRVRESVLVGAEQEVRRADR
jgi:hypothetical protein